MTSGYYSGYHRPLASPQKAKPLTRAPVDTLTYDADFTLRPLDVASGRHASGLRSIQADSPQSMHSETHPSPSGRQDWWKKEGAQPQDASLRSTTSSASTQSTAMLPHLASSNSSLLSSAARSALASRLSASTNPRSSSGSCAMSISSRANGSTSLPNSRHTDPDSSSSSSDSDMEDTLCHEDGYRGSNRQRTESPKIPARHPSPAPGASPPRRTVSSTQGLGKAPNTAWGVGLHNLGNTCFMNATLQCLAALPELVRHSQQHQPCPGSATAAAVQWAEAFAELLSALHCADPGSCISPSRFLDQAAAVEPAWGDSKQSDAQEFLRSLLDALHTAHQRKASPARRSLLPARSIDSLAQQAWCAARAQQSSVVSDLFEGQLQSSLTCGSCRATCHNFESFQDLSLPLPEEDGLTIQACLRAFTADEELEGEEAHRCEKCRYQSRSTKALRISRCPPVLVLHLKRFSLADPADYLSPLEKDTCSVAIPEDGLNLAPYCTPGAVKQVSTPLYDLFGVVCHYGSLEGGHYTACTRDLGSSKNVWVHYNDSIVEQALEDVAACEAAYLLFYRLRGSKALL